MAGIANRVQMTDQIFNTVLFQANPDVKPFIRRSWAESLPPPGDTFDPLVLEFEVVPASVWLLAERGPNEE